MTACRCSIWRILATFKFDFYYNTATFEPIKSDNSIKLANHECNRSMKGSCSGCGSQIWTSLFSLRNPWDLICVNNDTEKYEDMKYNLVIYGQKLSSIVKSTFIVTHACMLVSGMCNDFGWRKHISSVVIHTSFSYPQMHCI